MLGVCHLLLEFVEDQGRSKAPLVAGYDDCVKHMDWVLSDAKAIDRLVARCCGIFGRSYGQPATLDLADPVKPRTRGLLQKAFLEVKMLLLRAMWQIQTYGDSLLTPTQMSDYEAFMLHAYESCCKGGTEAQTWDPDRSAAALRQLICGGEATRTPVASDVVAGGGASKPNAGQKEAELQRALEDALQGLLAAKRGLDAAGDLGGAVEPERSAVAQACAGLQARLDGAAPSNDGGDAKRLKVA